jgi:hypothetical protein
VTTPTPSVGRIVHYTSHGTPDGTYGKECRAAIITDVDDYQPRNPGEVLHIGHVGLAVLNPTGMFFNRAVLQEEIDDKIEPGPSGRTGGTWHWPERV